MNTLMETRDTEKGGALHQPLSTAFVLAAHQHAIVSSLLNGRAQKLRELICALGSPLHIVLPQVFLESVRHLQDVFAKSGIDGRILYAKKANKADCFAKACADVGIGVDVASREELAKTLACGVIGERIGISGPEKSEQLLTLALRHDCLIAVDALSELLRIAPLAARLRTTARILLRVQPETQQTSRFGLTAQECDDALTLCVQQAESIRLEGFSFHLKGYSLSERAGMANAMIDKCLHAQALGLVTCRHVNIGGGLPVQHVKPECWTAFQQTDSPQRYHANKTFDGFYPYGIAQHGAQALHDLLNHPIEATARLADKARQHDIGLIVEPGRALLDQAGFTIFHVQGVKHRQAEDDYAIVTVQGSSLSLSEQWFNSEYLPAPVLLGETPPLAEPFLACIGGSTCLESDMLTWRKVAFARAILPGDCLVYLNTAGYQMDSNESPFHDAPLPLKVVMEQRDDSAAPCWYLDEN